MFMRCLGPPAMSLLMEEPVLLVLKGRNALAEAPTLVGFMLLFLQVRGPFRGS